MAGWKIEDVRRLAGIPLTESYDDDDDDGLSKAERELANAADKELKAKGVKVKDVDPDKELSKVAARTKTKDAADDEADEDEKSAVAAKKAADAEKADEPKADEGADTEDEKDDEKDEKPAPAATTAKKRGRAVDPNSNMSKGRAWIRANPDATLSQWKAHAKSVLGMGEPQANAFFYRHSVKATRNAKPRAVKENFWMLEHPTHPSFWLAENAITGAYEWSQDLMPLVFESEDPAKDVVRHLADWKGQDSKLVMVTL